MIISWLFIIVNVKLSLIKNKCKKWLLLLFITSLTNRHFLIINKKTASEYQTLKSSVFNYNRIFVSLVFIQIVIIFWMFHLSAWMAPFPTLRSTLTNPKARTELQVMPTQQLPDRTSKHWRTSSGIGSPVLKKAGAPKMSIRPEERASKVITRQVFSPVQARKILVR